MNRNFQLLNEIVNYFKQIPKIEAIALSGSSTANSDDTASDFDIYIYSDKEIDIGTRRAIALKYAENPEINNQYWETGDEWVIKETQKPIDIMYRSKEWIENEIKRVWYNHQASLGYTTCFIFNIHNSKILYDKCAWFKNLQEQTFSQYPQALSDNIIKKNLPLLKDKALTSYYLQIEKAVKRNDIVSVNHRISAFLASYFDIIFAKNKVLHPGEKKLVKLVLSSCKIIPDNFEKNITDLFSFPAEEKIKILDEMTANLKQIL